MLVESQQTVTQNWSSRVTRGQTTGIAHSCKTSTLSPHYLWNTSGYGLIWWYLSSRSLLTSTQLSKAEEAGRHRWRGHWVLVSGQQPRLHLQHEAQFAEVKHLFRVDASYIYFPGWRSERSQLYQKSRFVPLLTLRCQRPFWLPIKVDAKLQ